MLIKFLNGTELEIADLTGANLYGANLRGANLTGANLRGADLTIANLYGADLTGANLTANLRGANLTGAKLTGADLTGANLRDANLRDADLTGADLTGADLRGANLTGAKLTGANLRGTMGLEQQVIVPAGDLIGYKRLYTGTIARLHIPAQAKRVNAYGSRKCRAEFVIVLDGMGCATHDRKTQYIVGRMVKPDSYDPDPRVECSHGIHFFITEQEAKEYRL